MAGAAVPFSVLEKESNEVSIGRMNRYLHRVNMMASFKVLILAVQIPLVGFHFPHH